MYAVLYLAEFALQAVLRAGPPAHARAAALFAEQTKKSTVLAVNRAAREAGVEVGMTAPQAMARCPDLLVRSPNHVAESEARAALLAVGFTVSPTIEDTAPGVCTIDLKGLDPVRHRPRTAAAVQQLSSLGLIATAGIGATPLLALYAARTAAAGSGVPALPAATVASPPPVGRGLRSASIDDPAPSAVDDVHVVTDAAAFLGPLALAAADPAPAIANVLANWGVRTLGDLTALSRDDVGRRLGPEGLSLWDRAQGGASRPLHPVAPVQTFGAAMEFEDEIETLEPLLFILRRFLDRLTLELKTAGYVASAFDLTLTLSDGQKHARPFRLPEPTADVDILFRALHTHLESLRTETTIVAVELHITPARPLVRQQGLFETGLRDPHGFSETLARVSAIVGADRVGTPQLEDTHRPDAVTLISPATVIPPLAEPPIHAPIGLPLRRFRPPLRAQLELTDGKPTYLWTERFNGAIAHVRGPWLSSGDWWQADRAWRRTEYDVALATGGLYRLVLADRLWYLEGEYD